MAKIDILRWMTNNAEDAVEAVGLPLFSHGSNTSTSITIGGIDLVVNFSPAMADTAYEAFVSLENSNDLATAIAATVKSKSTDSVTLRLGNATLAAVTGTTTVKVLVVKS